MNLVVHLLAVAEHADAIPWLIVAGIVLIPWLVLFTVVASATMPRLPDPGPETMDLGPEPPAVANLLGNRCEVTTNALSATVIDLAARRHLTIERINEGDQLLRLRTTTDPTTAFEDQVLALLRDRADRNTVPATELSLGYGPRADKWWKNWCRAVIDHARDLGLVRRRFSRVQQLLLAGTLAIPFVFVGVAFEAYGAAERAAGEDFDPGGGVIAAGVLWLAVVALGAAKLRGWRETKLGSSATAHWLGVGAFLRHDDAFADTGPDGVAIWDRLLAYGAALGVAHGADAALPIGPTRDDEGWSPQRGRWRQVRITYPGRFGYGERPVRAAVLSALLLIALLAVGIPVARALVPELVDTAQRLADDRESDRWLLVPLLAAFAIPLALGVVFAVRWARVFLRALGDLGATGTVEGYVVRIPWHMVKQGDDRVLAPRGYTAVDDGSTDEIRALRFYDPSLREGQTVLVTLTPRLRHVVTMEPRGATHSRDASA